MGDENDLFTPESSRIGVNMAALAMSRVTSAALGLLQLGVIFRELPLEGTGRFQYALSYAAMFAAVATFGIQRLLVRDISKDRSMAWTYVWTAEALVSVLLIAVFGLIAVSFLVIDNPHVDDPQTRLSVLLAALSVVLLWGLQRPLEALLIARERIVWMAAVDVVAGLAKLAAVIVALRHHPSSATAHGAIAVGNGAAFLLCMGITVAVAGWERPRVRLDLALRQIRECFPFLMAIVFSFLYFKFDMVLLGNLKGLAASGIYAPVQRLMEPLLMFSALWGTVVFPTLCRFSMSPDEKLEDLKRFSARLALLAAFPMAVGLALLAAPAIAVLTGARAAEYDESVSVLRLMCCVIPFFYLNGVTQEFLYASHRDWFVVKTYGVAALVSIAANLVLIPRFGVLGATGVAVAVNALVSVCFVWGMRSEYGTMGLPKLIGKTGLACAAMAAGVYVLAGLSVVGAVIAGMVIYAALQLALGTLNRSERDVLVRIVRVAKWPLNGN